MMLVIHTQYMENYGAHDWDGQGECPQRWKFKGGSSYKVTGIPSDVEPEVAVAEVRSQIEYRDHGSEQYILGWSMEADDYLSEFETNQLEYDGAITYSEPVIQYGVTA